MAKSHDNIDRISNLLQSCGDLLVHWERSAPDGLHEENSFLPDDDGDGSDDDDDDDDDVYDEVREDYDEGNHPPQ